MLCSRLVLFGPLHLRRASAREEFLETSTNGFAHSSLLIPGRTHRSLTSRSIFSALRRAGVDAGLQSTIRTRVVIAFLCLLLALFATGIAAAQTIGVTYVCNGERMFIENCNMRDLSDTATCMVGHPDTVLANGLMKYTYEKRGDLKKLFPTCKQPSAAEIAKAQAFQKKQQDLYDANEKKATEQLKAIESAPLPGMPQQKPKTPEERALARCISSGRLPASCTGNQLLGAFTQMLGSVLPTDAAAKNQPPPSGPVMAGVFEGPGWRLDFVDGGVLVNCTGLSPNQEFYTLDFKNGSTALVIATKPKPLVLNFKADGTITGPGPVVLDGVVASGYSGGGGGGSSPTYTGGYHDANGASISDQKAASSIGPVYNVTGTQISAPPPSSGGGGGYATFSPKRVTCPALNLSSKGASTGIQTMQTDFLKNMFGGEKGAPTPAGIRMHGIYAAPTGFSVQFFPESAVLGCGPDAARAYPYTVSAASGGAVVNIAAPDHPLKLAFHPDGSLDPGSADPYQVHGRVITGQNDNDDFTFAPMETSCNLAKLTVSRTIPSSGGSAAGTSSVAASAGGSGAGNSGASSGGGHLSTPNAPTGNAVLTITSGFPSQPGQMNALAGHPYVLLHDDYEGALAKGGVVVPAGTPAQKYVASVCATRTPDCQKVLQAVGADAAVAMRADANGKAVLPGVPPGKYFLMISTQYNQQKLSWGFPVVLKPGPNALTLDSNNATVLK